MRGKWLAWREQIIAGCIAAVMVVLVATLCDKPVDAQEWKGSDSGWELPTVSRALYDGLQARYEALQRGAASQSASLQRRLDAAEAKIAEQAEEIAGLQPYRTVALQVQNIEALAAQINELDAAAARAITERAEAESARDALRAERDTIQGALRLSDDWRAVLPVMYPGCRFYQDVVGPSGSMRPTVYASDLEFNLIFEPSCPVEPQTGDILTFSMPTSGLFSGLCDFPAAPTNYVMHRAIAQTDGGFITKGDWNPRPDPCVVPERAILSKVVAIVPMMYPERTGDR